MTMNETLLLTAAVVVVAFLVLRSRVARRKMERQAAEEAARREAEQLAVVEAARREAERQAAEKMARRKAERRAAEEAAQRAAEQQAAAEAARREAERLVAVETARREAERKAIEEAAQREAERHLAEEAAQREAERQVAEVAAQREGERRAAEEAAQREAERQAAEVATQREAERRLAEEAAQREAERLAADEVLRQVAEKVQRGGPDVAVPAPALKAKLPEQTVVMVADDSKVVRIKTGRLLTAHKYQVLMADDGLDAARQIERSAPDVLITDVDMPGLGGMELVRQLRANPRTAHLPIIMVTSANDALQSEAVSSGANVVLGKPYPEEQLIAHIRGFMIMENGSQER